MAAATARLMLASVRRATAVRVSRGHHLGTCWPLTACSLMRQVDLRRLASTSSDGQSSGQGWSEKQAAATPDDDGYELDQHEADPERLPPMRELTYRETDFIGFDKKNILQEPEDERAHFRDLVRTYGQHLVARPDEAWPEREYVVSEDPDEWRHVEALMPFKVVPPVPVKDEYPSGFRPPAAKPGDYPYFVSRTANHMLPVYAERNTNTKLLTTVVRLADGDLFALRDDLKAFLFERYNMDFISQVAEVYGRVLFRGDFEDDFKEFLLAKGF
jgi:large subunit ribosomal protein L49